MEKAGKKGLTRREFVKAAGVGAVAAGVAPALLLPGRSQAAGKELKILVWSHFVPRFDKEWYDGFAKKWGEANGINVTVDHIGLAELPSRTAAEVAAGQGHDLIEWIAPPSQFEPSVLDMSDVVKEAESGSGSSTPSAAGARSTRTRRSSTASATAGRSTPARTGGACGRRRARRADPRRGKT